MKIYDSNPLGFNDENHLKNFINYLIRTDYAQKWTNDDTIYNCIAIKEPNGEFIIEMFQSKITERKKVAALIISIATSNLTEGRKNIKNLANTLHKIELELGETLNKKEYKDALLDISLSIDSLNNKKEKTICYTLHWVSLTKPPKSMVGIA